MADTLVKNPKLIVGTQSQVEAEMGDNDIGFATDIEFYNKAEIDEQYTSIITYVGGEDRKIKSDITQLDTNIRTVGDWVNAKDSEGNRATLTTEAQDAYRAINELNAKIGEGGGDYLPLSGGRMTGPIQFGPQTGWGSVIIPFTQKGNTGLIKFSSYTSKDQDYGVAFDGQTMDGFRPLSNNYGQLGHSNYKWSNVYTTKLNNGADIAIPTEGGTLARLEDLEGLGGASLPILMTMWSDHVIDDMSWLRADTFSWQSGDVYKAAHEHLVNDIYKNAYAWTNGNEYFYTLTDVPSVGDVVYMSDLKYVYSSEVQSVSGNSITFEHPRSSSTVVATRSADNDDKLIANYMKTTETIGDITIAYYLAEDGHKICLPDQESNLVALYEATGVAWYYLLDTENKQFKLPRTKFGFTGLRDAVGGYVEPGVPNIAGDSGVVTTTGTPTGVFARDGAKAKTWNADSSNAYPGTTFDASRLNLIYGASDTVQPPATQMCLYFYVGNFEQTAVEQTAGLNAELFNGKADVSRVEVLEGYDYVVEKQDPTSTNGYTWYRKYKSGWVEQGGRWTGSFSINAFGVVNTPVTLPVPMTDATYQAFAMATAQVGLLAITNPTNYQNTTTTLNVAIKEVVNGSRTVTEFVWQVSGYAA